MLLKTNQTDIIIMIMEIRIIRIITILCASFLRFLGIEAEVRKISLLRGGRVNVIGVNIKYYKYNFLI